MQRLQMLPEGKTWHFTELTDSTNSSEVDYAQPHEVMDIDIDPNVLEAME